MCPQEITSGAQILDLPDEVMVEIFSYITPQELHRSVAAVCRRWQKVAYYPYLWRNLTVHTEDLATFPETKEDLNENCWEKNTPFLDVFKATSTRLDSLTCRVPDKVEAENIIEKFKPVSGRLRHLRIQNGPINPVVMNGGISYANLISLTLEGVSFQTLNPFPDFSNLRCLHVLRCSMAYQFSPRAARLNENLLHFAKTCHHLQEFTLMGIDLSEDTLTALLESTKGRLKTLGFTIRPFIYDFQGEAIASNLGSSLEKLVIEIVNDNGWSFDLRLNLLGLRNLAHLKYLEFSGNGIKWNSPMLRNLFTASTFVNLEHLIVDSVSDGDRILKSIARNFCELKELKISKWQNVSDSGLRHILSNCQHLNELELSNLEAEVTAEIFATVPNSLQKLSFHFCELADDDTVEKIMSHHPGLRIHSSVSPLFSVRDLFE